MGSQRVGHNLATEQQQPLPKCSNFSTSSPILFFCLFFFIIATVMDVKWYLIVVLIFISLMTSVIRASFHVLIFFFLRNIYSSPLSIFKIVLLLLLLFLSFRTSPCVLDTNP